MEILRDNFLTYRQPKEVRTSGQIPVVATDYIRALRFSWRVAGILQVSWLDASEHHHTNSVLHTKMKCVKH